MVTFGLPCWLVSRAFLRRRMNSAVALDVTQRRSAEDDPFWTNIETNNEVGNGTGRFWDFEIERWLETPLPRQFVWELLDYSPYNQTGSATESVEKTRIR